MSCDVVNCRFTGYTTTGISPGGTNTKIVRCAFYDANCGIPITGVLQEVDGLELERLCFTGSAPFIAITNHMNLKRASGCCFPASKETVVIGDLQLFYCDKNQTRVDLPFDGFECFLPCDANNSTLTDVSDCTSSAFPIRPTSRQTDTKIVPPEPGDVSTNKPSLSPSSTSLPLATVTEAINPALTEEITPVATPSDALLDTIQFVSSAEFGDISGFSPSDVFQFSKLFSQSSVFDRPSRLKPSELITPTSDLVDSDTDDFNPQFRPLHTV
jgi:hypothetical protein